MNTICHGAMALSGLFLVTADHLIAGYDAFRAMAPWQANCR
jgi:hypothetical protein